MRRQCENCEYVRYCFWGLKFIQMYLRDTPCKQGRKVRETKRVIGIDTATRSDHSMA